jgi:arylsulfatase A-like enzyme
MTSKKPNLIFVYSDQHRAQSLGCYGERTINTPNLDAFSKEGALCTSAISPTPVCVPMRVANITGKLGHVTGGLTNREKLIQHGSHETIAHSFKNAGYTVGYIGKWHMGECVSLKRGDEGRFGFDDHWQIKLNTNNFYEWHVQNDDDEPILEKGYCVDSFIDNSISFLKTNSENPFCLYVSLVPPHPPLNPPEKYSNHKQYPLRDNVAGTEEERNKISRNAGKYAGLIESIDAAWGRLIKEVDSLGLTDNTILVYTSDHGEMLGSQGVDHKRWPFEESINIPFIIRYPGVIPPGLRIDMPFSVIDFYPTLCGLSGVSYADNVQGKDFSDVFKNIPDAETQDYVYLSMHNGPIVWPGWRGIRGKRYIYARTEDEPWILFDLEKDPFQKNNLVTSDIKLLEKMDKILADKMNEYNDSWREHYECSVEHHLEDKWYKKGMGYIVRKGGILEQQ